MPFSFPASPAVNDQSTQNGRTYSWSGYAWEIVATPAALPASVITSGTLDIARIPTGSTSSTVCIGNDARLSDARTPTSHAHGNISNAGAIGSTADQFVVTTTSGVLTAVSAATARTTLSVQPTESPTFTGNARVNSSDSAISFLVTGATKGVRFNISTNGTQIEGVDNTGVASYQPLILNGSTVTIQSNGGTSAITVGTSQAATFAGQVLVTAGSVSACSVAPSGDPNTGLYFPAADVAGIATNGTERVRVKVTGAVRFVPLSADPSTGNEAGDVYYNSSTNKLRVYNGTSWVDLH